MAASTTTFDWRALAAKLWTDALIFGTGEYGVVVRCFMKKEVHLFDDEKAARDFEAGYCCPSCARKHSFGSLRPYTGALAPAARVSTFRRNTSLHRWMTSED